MGSERVTRKSLRLGWHNRGDDLFAPVRNLSLRVYRPTRSDGNEHYFWCVVSQAAVLVSGNLLAAKTDLQAMAAAESAVQDWARSILAAFEKEVPNGQR